MEDIKKRIELLEKEKRLLELIIDLRSKIEDKGNERVVYPCTYPYPRPNLYPVVTYKTTGGTTA